MFRKGRRAMMLLSKYRKSVRNSKVGDLTSLIDVIFLLLIFFLLTSVTSNSNVEERIQTSKKGDGTKISKILYMKVSTNNTYMIDSIAFTLDELYQYFETENISKERNIAITSQEGALYSQVLNSIAPLVENGWKNISFMVK
jgi:biopolymer transport protein ExbD